MNRKYLHIAMFRALDCLYDEQEQPTEELLQFVSDANTYIWQDKSTADPAIQADFNRSMDRQNIGAEIDEESAYHAVKNFLNEQNPEFAELFTEIPLDECKNLCAVVTEEEEP